jgi:hypothetical protein
MAWHGNVQGRTRDVADDILYVLYVLLPIYVCQSGAYAATRASGRTPMRGLTPWFRPVFSPVCGFWV